MNSLKEYISTVTVFSKQSWETLGNCTTEMEFLRNEHLLNEGQICNLIYFTCSGLARFCPEEQRLLLDWKVIISLSII